MPDDILYDSPTFTYDGVGEASPFDTYDGVAVGPYAFFYPPIICDEPPFLPDSTPVQVGLWRHYKPGCRGVNVFLLSDGTYVQDTAAGGFTNVNIPYPINFNDPGAPIVQTTNWDGTVTDTFINPYVVKQYFGGHYNEITQAEADALTAAGYGPFIQG